MAKYTIEKCYRTPVFCHETIEAPDLETALKLAVESQDWEGSQVDYETAGDTYITAIWEGDKAYPTNDPNSPDYWGLDVPQEYTLEARGA